MNPQPEEGKASVKNIKDYLHLYLGCGMYNQGLANHLYAKGIPYTPQKLRTVGSDGLFWVGSEEDSRDMSTTQFKLILRPLSDMTEQERIKFLSCLGEAIMYADHEFELSTDMRFIIQKRSSGTAIFEQSPDGLRYLLSIQIDIFGLIESGLAIDKKTLNKQS